MNGVDVFSQMSLILSQLQAVSMPNVGGSTGGNQQSFESMMSDKRAEIVKTTLVNTYGIDAARISTESKGDTVQPFEKNDLNRVSICIVK